MNEHQKRIVIETQQWLFQSFPKCFRDDHALPLKVGILQDIFKAIPENSSISRIQVRRALKFYTNHPLYQKALAKREERFDLNGEAIGNISSEHKEVAEKVIALRRLKSFARRAKMGPKKLVDI
jgi:ProP effector